MKGEGTADATRNKGFLEVISDLVSRIGFSLRNNVFVEVHSVLKKENKQQ